ncbi:MAG: OmpA family protein, partial [Comamonadaceae bacterium]
MPFVSTRRPPPSAFGEPTLSWSPMVRGEATPGPRRSCRVLAALAMGALLGGCAGPATRVVLLPQPNGAPTAVVVRAMGGSTDHMLSMPYDRAVVERGEVRVTAAATDAGADVRGDNPALFELAPPTSEYHVIYFKHGDTLPANGFRRTLHTALVSALARSGGEIVVIGHTDTTGLRAVNERLARRRAGLVRRLLVERGFPPSRIEVVARGERELAVPTADAVPEAWFRIVS